MTAEIASQLVPIVSTAILTTLGTWIIARYTMRGDAQKEAAARAEIRTHEARYLAIRLVCELDPFIYKCCSVATDKGWPGEGGMFSPKVDAPIITLPTNVDWRCLSQSLMYRALSFPNDITAAIDSTQAAYDNVGTPPNFPEFFIQRRKVFAQLGLSALSLANDLRTTFEIPAREDRDEDPEAHLSDALSEAMRDELLASPQGALLQAQIARDALEAAGVHFTK